MSAWRRGHRSLKYALSRGRCEYRSASSRGILNRSLRSYRRSNWQASNLGHASAQAISCSSVAVDTTCPLDLGHALQTTRRRLAKRKNGASKKWTGKLKTGGGLWWNLCKYVIQGAGTTISRVRLRRRGAATASAAASSFVRSGDGSEV